MTKEEITKIETQLNIKLPQFYIDTMLNYPFPLDSFAAEFLLWANSQWIIDGSQSLFSPKERKFAIGSDGGELTYYLKLNGEEKVYIYDLERSYIHHTVEATWSDYLEDLLIGMERIKQDELQEMERKKNKKWWQFWI